MNEREALKLALEALENAEYGDYDKKELNEAITAIREALEQPEQEPKCGAIIEVFGKDWRLEYMSLPVGKHKLYTQQYTYTTPPQRKPLTDVTIWNTYKNLWMFHPAEEPRLAGDVLKFARAIEAAHGIKE